MQQYSSFKINSIEPYFAPFSASMMEQALLVQEGKRKKAQQDPMSQWEKLYQRFWPERRNTYKLAQQALRSGDFSTRWMITELTKRYPQKSKPLSNETISRWREIGLLRYQKDDYPDPDRAIAMLILRTLTTDKANAWTPKPPQSGDFWNEPLWTCWRQDTPTSPVVPCPVPLPADLPRHAILWTGYLGADLKSDLWLRIGDLGCCRWSRVKQYHDNLIWDITEADLSLWEIDTANYQKELSKDAPLTLHTLANLALLTHAIERLESAQSVLHSPQGI